MKPSILNGRDIGTLEFNNFITFRPRQKVKYSSMESQINFIFNNIKYDYLYYSWEKDKEYNHYHTHILLKINQPDFENYLYTNIKGYSNICKSERELMLRNEKKFTNTTTLKTSSVIIDEVVKVDCTDMVGRLGKVHLEPILDRRSVSYYINKYTDYGITTGFLMSEY